MEVCHFKIGHTLMYPYLIYYFIPSKIFVIA